MSDGTVNCSLAVPASCDSVGLGAGGSLSLIITKGTPRSDRLNSTFIDFGTFFGIDIFGDPESNFGGIAIGVGLSIPGAGTTNQEVIPVPGAGAPNP